MPPGQRALRAVALVLLLVAAWLRLADLGADPTLRFGAAHLSDEGYYARHAEERVRSGRWLVPGDNHNHLFLAPLTCLAFAPAFAVAGPSLAAARAVPALLGLAALLLVYFHLGRSSGPAVATAALALLALDPALVALARTALAEGPLLAVSLLFVVALERDLGRDRLPLLTWGAFALAWLTKASAVPLALTAVLAELVVDRHGRGRGRAVRVGLGLGAIVAAWYALYVRQVPLARLMFEHELEVHATGEGVTGPLAALAGALSTKHVLKPFAPSPLVLGLGVLGWALSAVEAARRAGPHPTDVVASAWLLAHGLFFSALPYQPPRYFLALAVPAAILAARLLGRPRATAARLERALPGRPLARTAATALLVGLPVGLALRSGTDLSRPGAAAAGLAAGLALALLGGRRRASGQVAALLLVLVAPVAALVEDLAGRGHDMARVAAAVSARLGPDSVVVGFFADTFTLGVPARAVVVHGPWNPGPDALARLGASHLLTRADELDWLTDRDPGLASRLVEVGRFAPQGGARGTLVLWRLDPAGSGATGK